VQVDGGKGFAGGAGFERVVEICGKGKGRRRLTVDSVITGVLTSVLKAQWLDPRGGIGFHVKMGSELDDEVEFSVVLTSEALRETPDRIAADLLRYIFFSVNWPDMVNTSEKLEKLVDWGHKFNS